MAHNYNSSINFVSAARGSFMMAKTLNLRGLEWIFGNFSQVAVIALIIIFQPELRKRLERAVSVRRTGPRDIGDDLSRLIVDSLLKLAEQRRGAIVVFPGREPIQEWLSGGHTLDARPSPALMMSIFDPNSPGHDGAIILEKELFTRFGVRLPVSQSATLSEEYGTRHHAAMGLAEKSDALVIAVSEERGKVSVFHKGKMTPMDDRAKLIDKIVSHWKKTASYPVESFKGKKRYLAFSQMLVSLLLAIFFWSMIVISQSEMQEKDIVFFS